MSETINLDLTAGIPPQTMAELRGRNYALIGNDTNTGRETLRYIDQLAEHTITNIDNWDMASLFVRDGALMADRAQINRIFFEQRKASPLPSTITPAVAKKLRLESQHIFELMSERIRREFENKVDAAKRAHLTYEKVRRTAARYGRSLWILKRQEPQNVMHAMHRVLQDGFYSLCDFNSNLITLETRPITLTFYDEDSARDMTHSFGSYSVTYRLGVNPEVYVYPLEGNTWVDKYYHPHVSTEAHICWGDLRQTALKAIASYNFEKTFDCVRAVLTSYSDGNPYANIDDFVDHGTDEAPSDPEYIEQGDEDPGPDEDEVAEAAERERMRDNLFHGTVPVQRTDPLAYNFAPTQAVARPDTMYAAAQGAGETIPVHYVGTTANSGVTWATSTSSITWGADETPVEGPPPNRAPIDGAEHQTRLEALEERTRRLQERIAQPVIVSTPSRSAILHRIEEAEAGSSDRVLTAEDLQNEYDQLVQNIAEAQDHEVPF